MKRKATIARSSPQSPDYKWARSSPSPSSLPPLPTYDWLGHDFAKDPRPLIAALESDQPLPKHLRLVLIYLLEDHRLVLRMKKVNKRTPSYLRLSTAEAKLQTAVKDYRAIATQGPIKRKEMNAAVEVLKHRAKSTGRGRVEFDPKKAAQTLRSERNNALLKNLAADYDLKPKTLATGVRGSRGSSRRR